MNDENDLKEKVKKIILHAITAEDCSPCNDLYMLRVDGFDGIVYRLNDTAWKIVALIAEETATEETTPEETTPSLPTFPDEDHSFHWFVGADGSKVIYLRFDFGDNLPWRVEDETWSSGAQLIADHPELFPLTEVGVEARDE